MDIKYSFGPDNRGSIPRMCIAQRSFPRKIRIVRLKKGGPARPLSTNSVGQTIDYLETNPLVQGCHPGKTTWPIKFPIFAVSRNSREVSFWHVCLA